jgi:hypothetical protein
MGASINGIPLRVNPRSVQWDYTAKVATIKTIGGKVIQLLGFNMGDLVIRGQYGRDGIERQQEFFNQLQAIADSQVPVIGQASASQPVRFLWPEKRWDFWVYIKSLIQDGTPVSIERSPTTFSPRYTLTLFVYEDNGNIVGAIKNSAQVQFLQRITAGMGWSQSEWNGPMTLAEVQASLNGASVFDYLFTPLPTPDFAFDQGEAT